ncbi:hypothetical protein Aph01nite_76820 [Acrocarpospora phusangensis]|uniref:Uncharacterized protein n=1 Tax=Acrocarpospora phusangensis TaxID=1070424 RepID=A0A919USL8_9ACTN|nr:hypothetical protein [Acrocarpospora phusangensis]GIH29372.1 hypothetical protein Aph01nite_76820 [Acrocarpospora phusangensis]
MAAQTQDVIDAYSRQCASLLHRNIYLEARLATVERQLLEAQEAAGKVANV